MYGWRMRVFGSCQLFTSSQYTKSYEIAAHCDILPHYIASLPVSASSDATTTTRHATCRIVLRVALAMRMPLEMVRK